MYRGLYRTSYARISRGTVTDTELQIGQFVVPRHGFQLVNQSLEDRMLRAWKEDLPEDHVGLITPSLSVVLTVSQWFPMEYYGNENGGGVNKHYYHVFNTVRLSSVTSSFYRLIFHRQPLYYKLPEGAQV
jgi:hypothetical protein